MILNIKRNELHFYVDLLRMHKSVCSSPEQSENNADALYNIIRVMKISRNNKLCGEDFSNLNFGKIPLNNIFFSMDGQYPCDFSRSILHDWNYMSGHESGIALITMSSNKKHILSVGYDNSIIMWNTTSGIMEQKMSGHSKKIRVAEFYNHDKMCLTGSDDCTVRIWDIATGVCLQTLLGHTDAILAVADISDRIVVTGGKDGSIIKWNTETGEIIKRSETHLGDIQLISFSPKPFSFLHKRDYCAIVLKDGSIKIWDLLSERIKYAFEGLHKEVDKVVFSNDLKYCLTYSEHYGNLKIWNIAKEKCVTTIESEDDGVTTFISAIFSYNNQYCFTFDTSGQFKKWEIKTGKCVEMIEFDVYMADCALSISEDLLIAVENPNNISVWNTAIGRKNIQIEWSKRESTVLSISPNGEYSAYWVNNRIYILNNSRAIVDYVIDEYYGKDIKTDISNNYLIILAKDTKLFLWSFRNNGVKIIIETYCHNKSISISPDGRYCMTIDYKNVARVWSTISGECISTINNVELGAFSANGKFFLAANNLYKYVLNLNTGMIVEKLIISEATDSIEISSIAISSDGKQCLIGYNDYIELWDFYSNNLIYSYKLWNKLSSRLLIPICRDWETGVAFSHDENVLIATSNHGIAETEHNTFYTPSAFHANCVQWRFPYCALSINGNLEIYEFDIKDMPDHFGIINGKLIASLSVVAGVFCKGCKYGDINASNTIKKVLRQYGANIESLPTT